MSYKIGEIKVAMAGSVGRGRQALIKERTDPQTGLSGCPGYFRNFPVPP